MKKLTLFVFFVLCSSFMFAQNTGELKPMQGDSTIEEAIWGVDQSHMDTGARKISFSTIRVNVNNSKYTVCNGATVKDIVKMYATNRKYYMDVIDRRKIVYVNDTISDVDKKLRNGDILIIE